MHVSGTGLACMGEGGTGCDGVSAPGWGSGSQCLGLVGLVSLVAGACRPSARPCGLASVACLPPALPCAPVSAAGGGVLGQFRGFLVQHFQWGGGGPRPLAPWGLPTHAPLAGVTCIVPHPPVCLPFRYRGSLGAYFLQDVQDLPNCGGGGGGLPEDQVTHPPRGHIVTSAHQPLSE